MSEYILSLAADSPIEHYAIDTEAEEIVRCRDCRHYYETDEYHPKGNYIRRCCKYFDSYHDEVEPDGFCAWGKRVSE